MPAEDEGRAPAEQAPKTAYLVTGDDPSLVSEAVASLLVRLTGGEPGGFVPVEEHGGDAGSDDAIDLGPVLDALATPPFVADRRVVVLRGAERLVAAQATELAARLADPVEGNVLVVVAGGRIPQALSKALKATGETIDTSPGQGRARADWVASRIGASSLHLSPDATRRLAEHLGEDVARLSSLLDMLEAAYGPGARLDTAALEPFLGETGSVPPWELTDAIDRGDGALAVAALHRLLGPGGRHPLQVMATLHRHFSGMLRLDGSGISSADEAASVLKMSTFPARKLVEQARRLGHDRLARALDVLAEADIDLRGRVAWPAELVLEVAVARLAQLGRATAAPAGRAR